MLSGSTSAAVSRVAALSASELRTAISGWRTCLRSTLRQPFSTDERR
jgi:hypothetical protein